VNFPFENIFAMLAHTFMFNSIDLFQCFARIMKIVLECDAILKFLFTRSIDVASLTRHLKDNEHELTMSFAFCFACVQRIR
jgi:hypothetical protein